MARRAVPVELTEEEREELEGWQRSQRMPVGLVRRGRAILLLAARRRIGVVAETVGFGRRLIRKWRDRFLKGRVNGLKDVRRSGRPPEFRPDVAMHIVKMACEMPDRFGRSLSQWDCAELARKLVEDGVVQSISSETVRRILQSNKLRPWRVHAWLSPKVPRDADFVARVRELCDLYTRPLAPNEAVLCEDEKTSLQPRPRKAETRPAAPGVPVRVEHEYGREGALNLLAAFDTRSGKVYGRCYGRKRQVEFIDFLEHLDQEVPAAITVIHIVCDNVSTHKGQVVQAWLKGHSRFVLHHPPVHCSWMNQVEQWFGILQRKRFKIADFPSKQEMAERIDAFIGEWNQRAHPFAWTSKSAAKLIAHAEGRRAAA